MGGRWPIAFAGFKLDLTTKSGALDAVADIRGFIKQTWSGDTPLLQPLTDDSVLDTLRTYKKQLDDALKPGALPLSPSAKATLARERGRLNDLIEFGDLLSYDIFEVTGAPKVPFADRLTALTKRLGPDKVQVVFGKDYPINVGKAWQDAFEVLWEQRELIERVNFVRFKYGTGLTGHKDASILQDLLSKHLGEQADLTDDRELLIKGLWALHPDSPATLKQINEVKALFDALVPEVQPPAVVLTVPHTAGFQLEVTPDQLKAAIKTLEDSKGIMVKQPLAKAGSPLADIDYHLVAKEFPDISSTKESVLKKLKQLDADANPTSGAVDNPWENLPWGQGKQPAQVFTDEMHAKAKQYGVEDGLWEVLDVSFDDLHDDLQHLFQSAAKNAGLSSEDAFEVLKADLQKRLEQGFLDLNAEIDITPPIATTLEQTDYFWELPQGVQNILTEIQSDNGVDAVVLFQKYKELQLKTPPGAGDTAQAAKDTAAEIADLLKDGVYGPDNIKDFADPTSSPAKAAAANNKTTPDLLAQALKDHPDLVAILAPPPPPPPPPAGPIYNLNEFQTKLVFNKHLTAKQKDAIKASTTYDGLPAQVKTKLEVLAKKEFYWKKNKYGEQLQGSDIWEDLKSAGYTSAKPESLDDVLAEAAKSYAKDYPSTAAKLQGGKDLHELSTSEIEGTALYANAFGVKPVDLVKAIKGQGTPPQLSEADKLAKKLAAEFPDLAAAMQKGVNKYDLPSDLFDQFVEFLANNNTGGVKADDIFNAVKGVPKVAPTPPPAPTVAFHSERFQVTFTRPANQPKLAGYNQGKFILEDQDGNEWMAKPGPRGEDFRVDVEHAAHEFADLLGWDLSDSDTIEFEGQWVQVQRMAKADGNMVGFEPSRLTDQQLQGVVDDHLLDWILDNDDAHNENLLRLPNGGILGIDKGRAWKHMRPGDQRRPVIGQLSSNANLYVEDVYSAVLRGQISWERFDQVVLNTLARAKKAARTDHDKLRKVLEHAFRRRPGTTTPSSRDQLIDAVLARLDRASEDFEGMFKALYARAGRTFPEAPQGLPGGASSDLLTGWSQEAIDAAVRSQNAGKAVYFGGVDVEDISALLWEEHGPTGALLRAQIKVREGGNRRLQTWLARNQTGSSATSFNAPVAQLHPIEKLTQSWYDAYLQAAKTISHHHGQGDKDYNVAKIKAWQDARDNVRFILKGADVDTWSPAETALGQTLSAHEKEQMLKALRHFEKMDAEIDQLMQLGGKSTPGQFTQFSFEAPPTPPPVQAPPSARTVVRRNNMRESGKFNPVTGQLEVTDKPITHGYLQLDRGQGYLVTEGDIEIEYRPHAGEFHVPTSQQGLLRVTIRSTGAQRLKDLNRATELIREMGLELNPVTEVDLEIHYWRHLLGVAQDRRSGKQQAYDKVYRHLQDKGIKIDADPSESDLQHWRDAWAKAIGQDNVDRVVAKRHYRPRETHSQVRHADETFGFPYWIRPDADSYRDIDDKAFLIHGLHDGSAVNSMVNVGGMHPTDERIRVLGQYIGGQSSDVDQDRGSAGFMFLRQNQEGGSGAQIYVNPRVFARTSTYSYNSDQFGDITGYLTTRQASAPWIPSDQMSLTGGRNETMVKNLVSLLDDIEVMVFPDESDRRAAVDYLKSHGITQIRGMAVDERFVTRSGAPAALRKAHATFKVWRVDNPLW